MKHPVVLDACTIINLLRIDEDEFLFRLLCSLRLYVADLVNQEIMKIFFIMNYQRNKEHISVTFYLSCKVNGTHLIK